MKFPNLYNFPVAVIVTLMGGCTTHGDVRHYSPQTDAGEIQKGVIFSLPKTVLEATITYSLYNKSTWARDKQGNPIKTDKDGKPMAAKSTAMVAYIDKPIQISTKTVGDPDMRFVFDIESLNGITKSTDITLDLTSSGLLKSSNTVVQDKAKEIISNVTGTLLNLAKAAAVAGVDISELVPVKEVVVTRMIDPSEFNFKPTLEKHSAAYSDKEKAVSLLGAAIAVPEVSIQFIAPVNISSKPAAKIATLRGIPYRAGSPVRVTVTVDDVEVYDQFHVFAQAGAIGYVPINATAFSDITQGIAFSDDGSYLTKVASKGSSSGEAASLAAKQTIDSIFSGIKDVDQARVDKFKKEKELLDAKRALTDAASGADTQAKIDKLKKEKELIDAELALVESKKKLADIEKK